MPFIPQASILQRPPRWLFVLLVLCYALPGLIARDPWWADDAMGFGASATMALGDWSSWATLNVFGASLAEKGPLGFWLGALFGKVWMALGGSYRWLDDVIRLSALVWVALTAWTLWETAFRLAKRPELQPPDPLGLTPGRHEYARTVADATVLCLIGTLGLLLRSHQTVSELPELLGISLILLGAVRAFDRPITAGWGLGAGFLVTLLSRGWVHGVWIVSAMLISSVASPALRFGLGHRLSRALFVFLTGGLIWSLVLINQPYGNQWLNNWWAWNLNQYHIPSALSIGRDLQNTLSTSVWFFWPLWPLSIWALWHFKNLLGSVSFRMPIAAIAGGLIGVFFLQENHETRLFPLIAPMCLLGAMGLTTLRRALISLIDWFALTMFSTLGLLIWLGYSAINFKLPSKIAQNFERLSPGYVPVNIPLEIAVALLATSVWIGIVVWRIKAHPRAVWRGMVLSASGTTLMWLLLMTLWLPYLNYAKTYQGIGNSIKAVIDEDKGCVATRQLGLSQRASLVYFGQLNVRLDAYTRKNLKAEDCSWLLVQYSNNAAPSPSAESGFTEKRWTLAWEGKRPTDKTERFVLYRRIGSLSDNNE